MKLIQIPDTLLHELNVLVDEQYNRIEDLQSKLDSSLSITERALDTAQRLQLKNIVVEQRNTMLNDSLLHYFKKDQERRTRASVTILRDYGSHQHLGTECMCRYSYECKCYDG